MFKIHIDMVNMNWSRFNELCLQKCRDNYDFKQFQSNMAKELSKFKCTYDIHSREMTFESKEMYHWFLLTWS